MERMFGFGHGERRTTSAVAALGFAAVLFVPIFTQSRYARAEPIDTVEIDCRAGKHTHEVNPDTNKIKWVLRDCICWFSKEEAKRQILAAIKGGATGDYEITEMTLKEGETVKTDTLYCYRKETLDSLRPKDGK